MDVRKNYSGVQKLNIDELHLVKGKVYGLVGPNGSGKSTLLKMIVGLVSSTTGTITIMGEKVSRKMAKTIAYLTDVDLYYETLTVKQMITFYSTQFTDFEIERANELLELLKIDEQSKIKHLSKGNRGRFKILLTFARKTPIILLDEPFAGLDVVVRDEVVQVMLRYIDFENQLIVIATHELLELEMLIDELIIISAGELLGVHNVEELREEQNVSVTSYVKNLLKR